MRPTPRSALGLAFLGKGTYRALLVRDEGEDGGAVELEERDAARGETLALSLRAGGGFVARLSRQVRSRVQSQVDRR
jgi:hypothetical protein